LPISEEGVRPDQPCIDQYALTTSMERARRLGFYDLALDPL
jgi:hypothetical protein